MTDRRLFPVSLGRPFAETVLINLGWVSVDKSELFISRETRPFLIGVNDSDLRICYTDIRHSKYNQHVRRNLMKIITTLTSILVLWLLITDAAQALTPEEQLGKSIFFDTNLSFKNNQSCAGQIWMQFNRWGAYEPPALIGDSGPGHPFFHWPIQANPLQSLHLKKIPRQKCCSSTSLPPYKDKRKHFYARH